MISDPDKKISYVYVIFRLNGVPCYVGKGHGTRWLQCRSRNQHLMAIFKQADDAGRDLPKVKVRQGLTDAKAIEIEIAMIAAIGREIHGGPLVNQTDGGDGVRGRSPEGRAAHSKKIKGRKASDETKARMSASLLASYERKGGGHTAETKALISVKARAKAPPSLETRAKMSAAKKDKPSGRKGKFHHSEETKAAISATKKKYRAPTPNMLANYRRMSDQKGCRLSDETRANMKLAWVARRAKQNFIRALWGAS